MERDIEVIVSQFRNDASRMFAAIAESFKHQTKQLNRQKDENAFQQLQSRYINELKKELGYTAEKIISRYNGSTNLDTVRFELTRQIEYYLNELLSKIRSL